jgi:ABC-type sugar transport system permease subunit
VNKRGSERAAFLVLVAPAFIFFLAFVAWPVAELFKLSLTKTDFITTEWVGLGNYRAMLGDEVFRQAALNSLAYMCLLVPGQVGGALLIALLAWNQRKGWLDFTRIAFYLPTLAAGAIVAQSWRWIFSPRGIANWLVGLVGIPPIAWFGSGATGIPIISLVLSMSALGTYVILLLAAMASLDKSMIDAAQVDGASWGRIKWAIVVPAIAPTIGTCATLAAIAAPQIYETVNFLAPFDYTASMTFQIYNQAFRYSRHGLAAAMAVTLMVVTIIGTLVKNRVAHAE